MTLPTYATLNQMKSWLKSDPGDAANTLDDVQLTELLQTASRDVETDCRRKFYVTAEVRTITPEQPTHIDVWDLLSVTTLKSDQDGDRTYETTWNPALDFYLEPDNAPTLAKPYSRITADPETGTLLFPRIRNGVQLIGTFGFPIIPTLSSATLAEDLDTSETGIDVTSGPAFAVGQTIAIGSEQLAITAIVTNTLTVTRGVNGTTAAAHLTGAALNIYAPPAPIVTATLLKAGRLFGRKATLLGVATVFDAQSGASSTISLKMDEDYAAIVNSPTYRRPQFVFV